MKHEAKKSLCSKTSLAGKQELGSSVDVATVPISDSLGIRVYSDTRPHNWKISDLQKGLIFVYRGVEWIGEGTGLGFPVLVCEDETFFPGLSTVRLSHQNGHVVIRKEYSMGMIVRNELGNARLENRRVRSLSRHLADLYQKHRHLRFLSLKSLLLNLGVQSVFIRANPAGRLPVTYRIGGGSIEIRVQLDLLGRKYLSKVFMLNEQGSRFFRRYFDSRGTEMLDKRIGAWDLVEPEWACLTDLQGRVGFRLWKKKNAILRVGREFMEGNLDWAGLDYEVDPTTTAFEYKVEVLGGTPLI